MFGIAVLHIWRLAVKAATKPIMVLGLYFGTIAFGTRKVPYSRFMLTDYTGGLVV